MITKAYIHEHGNGKLEPEHIGVISTLESNGIVCTLFTRKILNRNQLNLNKSTLVVGDNPTIETVFKRIGYSNSYTSYPTCLRPYLKRRIWETTVKKLLTDSQHSDISNVFIKPKTRAKLFTGFLINSNEDLYPINSISKNTKLYCSTGVEWLSEFRIFVNNSKIVGLKNYKGDPNLILNMTEVKNAILDFEKSVDKTAAYGIDFGILKNGETALIEWNDGFALGAYGLNKEVYTNLLLSRWNEVLTATYKD